MREEPYLHVGIVRMPLTCCGEVVCFKDDHATRHVAFGVQERPSKPDTTGLTSVSEVRIASSHSQRERVFVVYGRNDEEHEAFLRQRAATLAWLRRIRNIICAPVQGAGS